MSAIHLIKKSAGGLPTINKAPEQENVYTSGFWALSEQTAQLLINGKIYFHEQQREPSFFGGTIVEVEQVRDGNYKGRIVFKFIFSADCRGVKTSQDGWAQEMKIIL